MLITVGTGKVAVTSNEASAGPYLLENCDPSFDLRSIRAFQVRRINAFSSRAFAQPVDWLIRFRIVDCSALAISEIRFCTFSGVQTGF